MRKLQVAVNKMFTRLCFVQMKIAAFFFGLGEFFFPVIQVWALATNAVDGDIWAQLSSKEYKALEPLGRVRLSVPVFPRQEPLVVDFTPPGGGRGYYRTPTLVSLWATAPYLHNNAVGDYYVIKKDGSKLT